MTYVDNTPANKSDVTSWESVASFVSTFPSDDGEGACDVDVQIGEAGGLWFVRTRDDAGGSDDAENTAHSTRDEAEAAADALATECNEGETGESAEDYLRRADEAAAGEPDADGEWCVYWETALDDAGPRERYTTQEQAEAAAKIANADLHAHNPGGNLLCGFSVRSLVDGVWTESEAG